MTRFARALSCGLVLVMLGTSCFGKARDPSILQVTALSGTVEMRTADDAAWEALEKDQTLPAGASVRVGEGGTVTLARGEKSSIELRPSESQAEIVVGTTVGEITLRDGDALVTTDPSAPISVASLDTTASAEEGIFRFDRRLKVRVGSYTGAVAVAVETGALPELPALDEWLVNPRIPPVRQPYSLEITDPWDRRLLPAAIEVEEGLGPLTAGYESQFGRRTKATSELEAIRADAGLPNLGFIKKTLATTPSSDVLVGLALSLLLAQADLGAVPRAYREMIDRRRAGAAWGLIAHERGLAARDVLNSVTCEISLRTGEAKPGERCFAPVTTPTQAPTSRPPSTQRPTTQPSESPTGGPSPSPTRTKPPTPTPSPSRTPSPSPSPSPSCILPPVCVFGP